MDDCRHVRVQKVKCNLFNYQDNDITCLDCWKWLFCPHENEVVIDNILDKYNEPQALEANTYE